MLTEERDEEKLGSRDMPGGHSSKTDPVVGKE